MKDLIKSVRSNDEGVIGFLNENKRLNVAISRAKYCCFIIGNVATLLSSKNIYWEKLINYHKTNNTLFDILDSESVGINELWESSL